MCIAIEKPKNYCFSFNQQQYYLEVALMRKRIENLLNTVENIPFEVAYDKFKESLKNTDHENLKK